MSVTAVLHDPCGASRLVVRAAMCALLAAVAVLGVLLVADDVADAVVASPTTTPSWSYDHAANRPATGVEDDGRSNAVERPVAAASGHVLAPADEPSAPNTARNFSNYGGEFLDDAIRSPVVRPDLGNLSSKIQRQMGTRGWTPDLIDEAVLQGRGFPAVNKLGGANTPATRYVHLRTGQSVVIDNATGEVIHVGGPGFRY